MKMLTEVEHNALVARAEKFDIIAHLKRQAAFSERTGDERVELAVRWTKRAMKSRDRIYWGE